MKANQFVKQFGIAAAYDLWEGAFPLYENNMCILNGCVCTLNSEFMFNLIDIKHLIESHELIKCFNGVSMATYYLLKSKNSDNIEIYYTNEHGNIFITYEPKLQQAISDVESCQ